jgi:cytochrome c553
MIRLLLLAVVAWPAFAAAQTAAPAAAPALPDVAKIVNEVCAACHGTDGNSVAPANPSLAGQPADYITRQLAHFKDDIRPSAIMKTFAAALSDEQMAALGLYFAHQKPKPQAAKDPALVKAGQKVYRAGVVAAGVPACSGCHSPDGVGIPKNYPRLGGQYADYTYAQLKAFGAGERGDDKAGKDVNGRIMHTVAQRMSDDQMKAVAEYVQGLR